jgi:hypothetical protein
MDSDDINLRVKELQSLIADEDRKLKANRVCFFILI